MSSATNPMRVFFCVRACVELLFRVLVLVSACVLRCVARVAGVACCLRFGSGRGRGEEGVDTLPMRRIKGILAEGAIALPVTLSGGVLFAS